ncbi:MAG TPA: alkaline phosphatase family protein [Capsulimonadaceae bacterium]|nr:alkaline phosphatase family protein [Capsulimonadaceae bacterium]
MKMSASAFKAVLGISTCLTASLLTPAAFADPSGPSPHSLPAYDKIVIVIEENQQEVTIIGNPSAPYTNALAAGGALITNSYGCEHPSQPNYLDLFSGSDQNVYGDALPATFPFSVENLGAELLHHGLTFVGYSEDLPFAGDATDTTAAGPADPPGTADYARKHNPWANWQNDDFSANIDNQGSNYLPSWTNQPLTPFTAISMSHKFPVLPTVSIVVPNQQHDDHGVSGGLSGNALIAAGDTWLQQNIGAYANWAKTHNSLLIVTWDEDDFSASNRVPTIFYGAHVRPGQYPELNQVSFTSLINADNQPSGAPQYDAVQGINHWNVLRTVEDIYGLGHVGQSEKVQPITDLFK